MRLSMESIISIRLRTICTASVKGFRDKVHLATKVGIWHINEGIRDAERLLHEQLQRLQTDYIDFYMIHALTDRRWERFRGIDIVKFLERKKREGLIRHYGFSYHGTARFFKQIIDEYDWEFIQIPFNYVDTNVQAEEQGLIYAAQKGVGVAIMEPLRGGQLVDDVHDFITSVLVKANALKTPAQWGLDFLWNRSEIDVVLSGMNHIDQVKENILLAEEAHEGMLKREEADALEHARRMYGSLLRVPCTLSRYCDDCPQDVYIPWIIQTFNNAFTMNAEKAKNRYHEIVASGGKCIGCGKCEEACPQNIEIIKVLEEAAAFFNQGCKGNVGYETSQDFDRKPAFQGISGHA
jgi:predicted aldo/keto reductase-like oxidoreductase